MKLELDNEATESQRAHQSAFDAGYAAGFRAGVSDGRFEVFKENGRRYTKDTIIAEAKAEHAQEQSECQISQ